MKLVVFLALAFSKIALAQGDVVPSRNAREPLANMAECVRGSDSSISIGGMPTLATNEHLQSICAIKFVQEPDVDDSQYFASSNIFVSFDSARHQGWMNFMKPQGAIKEQARDFAEASADREAIGNCQAYALANDRDPNDCRWLAAFETSEGFFTVDDGNSTEGGYWARSLAILPNPTE